MKNILEFTLDELKQLLIDWEHPKFYGQQIFSWIYKKQSSCFEAMSNLPGNLRDRLKENFCILDLKPIEILNSEDGVKKLLFELNDHHLVEGVLIPAKDRVTGCISTQVGCKFSCFFCASGLLGFKRNLSVSEILQEALCLKSNSSSKKLTHLVFMGTGEPLDNYENVLKAIRIINSDWSFNIGARRITISTCGIIPAINKLSKEALQIELSVSLHAADDKTRSRLVPINKRYPLGDLIAACREYIEKTNRQITFEYVLIKNINSSIEDAQKLTKILKGLRLVKINLISANPVKELNIEPPNKLEISAFAEYLLKAGVKVTLRKPRGQDIEAACGQLRLHYEKI